MLSTIKPLALAFVLAAPALANSPPPNAPSAPSAPPASTPSVNPITATMDWAHRPLGTAIGGALHHGPIDAAFFGLANAQGAHFVSITVQMVNMMTVPVSAVFASTTASPGQPQISLVNDPTATALAPGATGQVVMPQGWAGSGTFGIDGDDRQGSKWEASLDVFGFQPMIDVSYVDGYSVPLTCSCAGIPVTGCNIELWDTGIPCPASGPGPTCYNPLQRATSGPAQAFFAPCAGGSFTFPTDNTVYNTCAGSTQFDCCIGTECTAPSSQPPPPRTVHNSSRPLRSRRGSDLAA